MLQGDILATREMQYYRLLGHGFPAFSGHAEKSVDTYSQTVATSALERSQQNPLFIDSKSHANQAKKTPHGRLLSYNILAILMIHRKKNSSGWKNASTPQWCVFKKNNILWPHHYQIRTHLRQ
jgi:hypothetical protein